MENFTFASFTFPRAVDVAHYGHGAKAMRKRADLRKVCGPYTTAPKPLTGGSHPGTSFYLDSDFAPGLRWSWCDEVKGARINHRGWFTDDEHQGDTLRGIVLRLPHGRGFLAGWSMGEGMASNVDGDIYADELDAARVADQCAEYAAERERDYQARQRAEEDGNDV